MEKLDKIVFVCTGNTCRSPMAEGIARATADSIGIDVTVSSAGVGASPGSAASDNAIAACREIGVDISEHRSSFAGDVQYDDGTLFAVMEMRHGAWLHHIAGVPIEQIILLGDGVIDPYGGDIEVYRRCRDGIRKNIIELFERLDPLLSHREDASRRQPMACRIAAMTEADLDGISEIEAQCFSDAWSRTSFEEELGNAHAKFIVAHIGDEVCGYGGIMVVADTAELPKLCVAPERRRLGIARALLTRLISLARKNGAKDIALEVRESNAAAIELYKQAGFEPQGKRAGFYTNPAEDALIMTLNLDD